MNFAKKFFSGLFNFSTRTVSLPLVLILILVLVSSWLTVSLTRKYPERFGLIKGPEIIKKEEDALIAKVRSLIDLPENERPTIASVTDKSKLENQAFFTKTQDGDRVLIFSEAKKVVLYRPSEERIVEVGAVNIQSEEGEVAGATSQRFALLNSTTTSGLTRTFEEEIKSKIDASEVVERGNALSTYETTFLVDLSGEREDEAEELAVALGISVGDLPQGENRPENADFLVILGRDRESSGQPTSDTESES